MLDHISAAVNSRAAENQTGSVWSGHSGPPHSQPALRSRTSGPLGSTTAGRSQVSSARSNGLHDLLALGRAENGDRVSIISVMNDASGTRPDHRDVPLVVGLARAKPVTGACELDDENVRITRFVSDDLRDGPVVELDELRRCLLGLRPKVHGMTSMRQACEARGSG